MTMDREERSLLADTIWEFMPRATSEEIREQRRYEIAKECMARYAPPLVAVDYQYSNAAVSARKCADALLDELEKAK
jgi:hypothetical protein